jgi:hypothetical protein
MEGTRPKAVFNVRLIDDSEIKHVYEIPKDANEAWEFLNQMVDMISRGLSRQSPTHLVFENPSVWYNPDNVVGVGIESPKNTNFERFVNDVHKTIRVKQATTKTARA